MFGPIPSSRLALILRRLRGRFGVSAPKVAVRTHVPLPLRMASIVVLAALALALAGWTYDAGRRIAGFDRTESEQEINALHDQVARLETEAMRLRGIATTSESHLQIERTTLDQLTLQVRTLEAENVRLKEELAVFENLAKGEGPQESLSISRLRVVPDGVPGNYRYNFLVAQNGVLRGKEFRGSLQIAVTLQQNNDSIIVLFPRANDSEAAQYAVSFKNFRRLDGSFRVPSEARVKVAEVRLVQDGVIKATQKVTF